MKLSFNNEIIILDDKHTLDINLICYIIIPIVVGILYYQSLFHSFIQDDFTNIYSALQFNAYNVFIKSFFTIGFYRPITNVFDFFISHLLFGMNPIGYHTIIFCLFTLNGILVYSLAKMLMDRIAPALLAAILYVTSGALFISIYWISAGFNETGTAFLMLAALFLYLRYLKKGNRLFYISSLAVSIIALMSKESAIVLPLLILLIDVYDRGFKISKLRYTLLRAVPFFAISAIYASRLYVIRTMISSGYYQMSPDLNILLNNLFFYLTSVFNGRIELLLSFLVIAPVILIARNRKIMLFSLAWFAVCVLPYIFLIDHSYTYYLSMALVGTSILFSTGLYFYIEQIPSLKIASISIKYFAVAIIFILLMLSCYNYVQTNEPISAIGIQERTSNNIISYLKGEHAYLPDNSLIYVKGADYRVFAAMGYGESAIKLYYGDNVSIYFENITESLPKKANFTYNYTYENDTLIET